MLESKKTSVEIDGKEIHFETGKVARQANGAVVVRMGDTIVFSAACASKEPLPHADFLPLGVHYTEKFSSVGKTLSGYIKREGRPTQKDVLSSRLIDRPLRPLFPKGYHHDVQVTCNVWSYDGENSPEILALNAASAALVISDIPLVKPVGGVRVGRVDGQFVVNPSAKERSLSDLDLVMAGTEDAVLMIEGYCDFLTEAQVLEAIEFGHKAISRICQCLKAWAEELGKEKSGIPEKEENGDLKQAVRGAAAEKLKSILQVGNKQERETALEELKETVVSALVPEEEEEGSYSESEVKKEFKSLSSEMMRNEILNTGRRCDGRGLEDIRPIWIEEGLLPRSHGSALFTRGETQTMAVCTLGGENMAQRYEDLDGDSCHRFYLQYSFPPYSVGETGRMGPPGRREVGHGKLAERALAPALPEREKFPYVIRLESNITESNGSSSMASVCGGYIAMKSAGVPMKRPVAGIAMGLILEEDRHVILSDILGIEDALGDMDFKITGDREGITAFQMDIKVEGITPEIMASALKQAKKGRLHILGKMEDAWPEDRQLSMSKYAPRIESLKVPPSKIAVIIGPGGKQIRSIIDETGVEIDIEDDGRVNIISANLEGLEKAKKIVGDLIAEVEIGRVYEGKIKSVVPFGVFVEILPGKEGLCHISEVDNTRIEDIFDVYKEGDNISVKVLDINERGQVKLSRKATLV